MTQTQLKGHVEGQHADAVTLAPLSISRSCGNAGTWHNKDMPSTHHDGDRRAYQILVKTSVLAPTTGTIALLKTILRQHLKKVFSRNTVCIVWDSNGDLWLEDAQPLQQLDSPLLVTLAPEERLRNEHLQSRAARDLGEMSCGQPQAHGDTLQQANQELAPGSTSRAFASLAVRPPLMSYGQVFQPRPDPARSGARPIEHQQACRQIAAEDQALVLAETSWSPQLHGGAPIVDHIIALHPDSSSAPVAGDHGVQTFPHVTTQSLTPLEQGEGPQGARTGLRRQISYYDDDQEDASGDGHDLQLLNLSHQQQIDVISRRLRASLTEERKSLLGTLQSWDETIAIALGRVTGLLGQESVNLDGVKPAKDEQDYEKVTARRRLEMKRITAMLQQVDDLQLNMRNVLAMTKCIAELEDDVDPAGDAEGTRVTADDIDGASKAELNTLQHEDAVADRMVNKAETSPTEPMATCPGAAVTDAETDKDLDETSSSNVEAPNKQIPSVV